MVETRLIEGALPPIAPDDTRRGDGAELIFHGRVREHEGADEIVALDYEHYPEMTERELRALAEETAARFPVTDVICLHRIGRVAVGEASLRVTIVSPHRVEALDAMTWFVAEMKRRVPIWKWAVSADGERRPT